MWEYEGEKCKKGSKHSRNGLKEVRSLVSTVTHIEENRNNWGENNYMEDEVKGMLQDCHWSYIYDTIEVFYKKLDCQTQSEYESDINRYFCDNGIGWQLKNGVLEIRGDDSFEEAVKVATAKLADHGFKRSSNEIRDALRCLSMRPNPDITGAITHVFIGLECLGKALSNCEKDNICKLITHHLPVPESLKTPLNTMYGYANKVARHSKEPKEDEARIKEERVTYEEAELIVHICAAVCIYLVKKSKQENPLSF